MPFTDADRKAAKDATCIEPLTVQEEYIRVPGDLAYWNERYAQAYRLAMLAEHTRRTVEARVQLELRAAAKAEGAKPTVDEVAARVTTHSEVTAALLHEIETQAEKEQIRGILEAIRAKKEMLISLGAHLREEMRDDPSIRTEQRIGERERRAIR